MQTNEKIEIIRKACVLANPAIMELGFGCEIRFKLYQELFVYIRQIKNNYHQVIKKWGDRITEIPDLNEVIILGRPIRLADVLLAIGKKIGINGVVFIDQHGQFYRALFIPEIKNLGIYWNLREDSLDKQSPETLAFLAGLLSENK